jgi:hypothetical protein
MKFKTGENPPVEAADCRLWIVDEGQIRIRGATQETT